MNSKQIIEKVQNQKITLHIELGDINKILTALGHLKYNQVHDLIENIRIQTELHLTEKQSE